MTSVNHADNATAAAPPRPLVAVAAAVLLRHATAPTTPMTSGDFANPLANYSNPAAYEFL